ncbi:hypothetical protein ONS95_005195 [Cadophora gregata]|uniref:uncharacterized protein n=1 Tax=Cadophora gregata TaxID=51156 RepID=UPI0026DC5CCC|nr:uncharacterized protein ONS95_005195 [Cadophora gregata]KAK0104933.1 hypothetical protein ONS95_005195 [Cadophora gregata]
MLERSALVFARDLLKSVQLPRSEFYHQHPQTRSYQTTPLRSTLTSRNPKTTNTRVIQTNSPQNLITKSSNSKMGITGPLAEMLSRNNKNAETYQAPPPLLKMVEQMKATKQGVVVLSCSDPRLNPYQVLGLDATLKATMVRNAGGRVLDAIRTLAVLQTIGNPGTIVVMHHTDCGMTHFHDSAIKQALTEIAPGEKQSIESSKFGEITGSIEESVLEDLALLRASPLIKKDTQIVGLKYDIFTGILTQVHESRGEL